MSGNEREPLVPKLRFPEFLANSPWEPKELAQLLTAVSNGISLPQNSSGLGLRVTRIETIADGKIDLDRVGYVDVPSNEIKDYRLKAGDILLSNINSITHIGKSILINEDLDIYHGMNLLRLQVDTKSNYPQFIYFSINTPVVRGSIRKRANKAVNQASINQTELGRTIIPSPSRVEQEKVADCLSSLDDLIAAEIQMLDTLKTYKKGLMQQLFPREGETVPRLRFPEFREAGKWRKEKLGAIANLYKGKGISKADIVPKGAQPCIRYGELYTIYGEVIHNVASSTNVNARDLLLSKKHDVIIPASGETKIDIAKASCVMHDEIALGGDLNVIRSSQNGIFLSYQLNGPLRLTIARVAQGDTVVHLYPTQIEQLDVLFPTPDEQQRIADFLSSIDDLITVQSQKIDALKTHKKGLMQQLFPVLDEVSA